MQEPNDRRTATEAEESTGKVDLASVLYVATGIPGIVLFLWVLFGLARSCNIPA
jgi:hypothetical protein